VNTNTAKPAFAKLGAKSRKDAGAASAAVRRCHNVRRPVDESGMDLALDLFG
jgi:hypothetical protein